MWTDHFFKRLNESLTLNVKKKKNDAPKYYRKSCLPAAYLCPLGGKTLYKPKAQELFSFNVDLISCSSSSLSSKLIPIPDRKKIQTRSAKIIIFDSYNQQKILDHTRYAGVAYKHRTLFAVVQREHSAPRPSSADSIIISSRS